MQIYVLQQPRHSLVTEHQFSGMPTLGEFIQRAKAFGVALRHTPTIAEGPRGPVRFYYLQRTVENWCTILGIPGEDFGVPSDG